jgi:hypothetical protein
VVIADDGRVANPFGENRPNEAAGPSATLPQR